jgi:hypothetical protein
MPAANTTAARSIGVGLKLASWSASLFPLSLGRMGFPYVAEAGSGQKLADASPSREDYGYHAMHGRA